MIPKLQQADPFTLHYLCNGKKRSVTYEPLIINGKVINDNQKKSIEILYEEGFKYPYLKDQELDGLIKTGEVKILKKHIKFDD